jgi:uncharacterized protein YcaQ
VVAREHAEAIDEMRAVLRERGEVGNRDFSMRDRSRVDHYRGRKDSALALHYLWRVGEVMVSRRERFERVYALTEAVAPPAALREVDDAEADDVLLRKAIAADGLWRPRSIDLVLRRPFGADEMAARRRRWLEGGDAIEVRIEGWRTTQLAVGADADLLAVLEAGRVPDAWTPLGTTTEEETTFLSPLDPVSARGRAKPLFGFEYAWEVYKPADQRRFGYYTLPVLWGDRLVARFDPKLDRSTGTLVINGLWLEDPALARDGAFGEALGRGMTRFTDLLGATSLDATAVGQPALRRRLAASCRGRGRQARAPALAGTMR